jgi:single-strand DNA-binding protein
MLYIEGKITSRSYDAKDGSKRYITEIVGSEMKMLGGKPASGGHESAPLPSASEEPYPISASDSETIEVNDLPF